MVELEPMTLLPALAMVTRHVGLVTTASTTYNEPYNIARRFATLDLISKGRAGWNVVASWSEHEAQNFGLETTLDYDTRYARSAEFVDVVKGLWDGWDDGALLLDKAGGRYFDEAKMHVLNHHGRFFKVRGPLSVTCMPQGHPVIVQAGASESGSRRRDPPVGDPHREKLFARCSGTWTPLSTSSMALEMRLPGFAPL